MTPRAIGPGVVCFQPTPLRHFQQSEEELLVVGVIQIGLVEIPAVMNLPCLNNEVGDAGDFLAHSLVPALLLVEPGLGVPLHEGLKVLPKLFPHLDMVSDTLVVKNLLNSTIRRQAALT